MFSKVAALLLLLHGAASQDPDVDPEVISTEPISVEPISAENVTGSVSSNASCFFSGYAWNSDGALTQEEWGAAFVRSARVGSTAAAVLGETAAGTNEVTDDGMWTIFTSSHDANRLRARVYESNSTDTLFDETYTLNDNDGDQLVFRGVYTSPVVDASVYRLGRVWKYAGTTLASVTFNDDAATTRSIEVCIGEA
ncbi:hypothetical protein M885DRAFT_563743 [Pelagophyceae sp. CCMP2097]|nr:hypothetical protein M885DRAFT_563743 [Pelagophyceae sp. CCMP2097]